MTSPDRPLRTLVRDLAAFHGKRPVEVLKLLTMEQRVDLYLEAYDANSEAIERIWASGRLTREATS